MNDENDFIERVKRDHPNLPDEVLNIMRGVVEAFSKMGNIETNTGLNTQQMARRFCHRMRKNNEEIIELEYGTWERQYGMVEDDEGNMTLKEIETWAEVKLFCKN